MHQSGHIISWLLLQPRDKNCCCKSSISSANSLFCAFIYLPNSQLFSKNNRDVKKHPNVEHNEALLTRQGNHHVGFNPYGHADFPFFYFFIVVTFLQKQPFLTKSDKRIYNSFLFTIKIAEQPHSSHIYGSFMHSLVSMLNGYSETFQI